MEKYAAFPMNYQTRFHTRRAVFWKFTLAPFLFVVFRAITNRGAAQVMKTLPVYVRILAALASGPATP